MERERHMTEATISPEHRLIREQEAGKPLSAEEIKVRDYIAKNNPYEPMSKEERAQYKDPEQADAIEAARNKVAREQAVEEFIKANQGIPVGLRKAFEKEKGSGHPDDEIIAWVNSKNKESEIGARAERFGLPAEPRPGWKYEWIHSQQLGEMPVEWPDLVKDDENPFKNAEKHIKNVLGRIELAQSSPTQQMQVDFQNAQSVLEVLELRQAPAGATQEEKDFFEHQQKWAEKMRNEMKARLQLHNAYLAYEGGGSIDDVKKAMLGLDADWMNIVFGLEEKIEGINETFNPFVEALQYYEDHGHEFARNNWRELRPKFQEKVQKHIGEFVAKKRGVDPATINFKTYEWASNMAERMFRATGRAIMYDYLIINKDGKDADGNPAEERMVDIDYSGPGSPTWAGGRDGCDYPMSKIYRFRENLKSDSEFQLMRPYIHLFDGVDLFAGDFWKRTIKYARIETKENKDTLFARRVAQEDYDVKVKEKIADLIKNDNKSPAEAKEIAEKLFLLVKGTSSKDPREREYAEVDIYSDRDARTNPDNKGEEVGHIDFRRMARKVDKKGELIEGIEFKAMGDTPFSLWCSRMLAGPGGVLDKLTGSREAFALNPNFKTLAKLIDAFDYSKKNAWEVRKQLVKNLIKYLQSEAYAATGKAVFTDEEIIAGVNELTGLTDPNAPQFIQLEERTEILAEFFHIIIPKDEKEKIREQAEKQAKAEVDDLIAQKKIKPEYRDEEIKHRTNTKAQRIEFTKLNKRIERKTNIKFAKSFAGQFLWGAVKAGLKQFLAELGLK